MRYGHFDDAAKEYVIETPATPLPWINYLGNKDFFSLISNTGGGYSFYKDAKLRRITRYRYNNVPADNGSRCYYLSLMDSDSADAKPVETWSPTFLPCKTPLDSYKCRQGIGYTVFEASKRGIESKLTAFVPLHTNAEINRLDVTNTTDEPAVIDVTGSVEWCLWNAVDVSSNFQRNLSTGEVEIERETDATLLYHKTEFKERRNHYAFYGVNAPVVGFDTSRDEFLGQFNGWDTPQVIAEGKTDFIAIGRGLIADPDWARKAQFGRTDCIRQCISCNIGCADHRIFKSQPIRCTVNPDVIGGDQYKKQKVTRDIHVVIIGGGTSGLEAACSAAEVGCRVTLLEREDKLGGLTRKIALLPEKKRIEDFPAYLERRAAKLPNLTIRLNTTATKELLAELKPDILYAATGSRPMLPPIEGLRELTDAEGSHIRSIYGFMDNIPYYEANAEGKKVVVIGCGAVGLDVMEFFTLRKADVTMIEMMPSFGKDADIVSKATFKELLEKHPVDMHLSTSLEKVCPDKFIASHNGESAEYPFDYGFICMGLVPDIPSDNPFEAYAKEQGIPFCNFGNSRKTGQIIHGTEVGRDIVATIDMIGGFDD